MLNVLAAIHGTGVAASTNSYESIATTTVGAGGSSTITFSSIPSTYKHLQVRYIVRDTFAATYDFAAMRLNGATSGYSWHFIQGNGSGVSASAGVSASYIRNGIMPYNSELANSFGVGVVDILDYADTNKFTTTRTLNGFDGNGTGAVTFNSGLYQATTAVSSVTFYSVGTAFAQYSQFALYGIKG